jgi:LPXTG-motif cell wall anchor domain protein
LGSTADDSVNTGDNFNLYMYIMLLAVSGAALFLSKKKKCKNN